MSRGVFVRVRWDQSVLVLMYSYIISVRTFPSRNKTIVVFIVADSNDSHQNLALEVCQGVPVRDLSIDRIQNLHFCYSNSNKVNQDIRLTNPTAFPSRRRCQILVTRTMVSILTLISILYFFQYHTENTTFLTSV